MYNSPNSLQLFSLVWEAKEVVCSGVAHEQQEETLHDLKGGGHDPQNEEVEEHVQEFFVQIIELIVNDTGE